MTTFTKRDFSTEFMHTYSRDMVDFVDELNHAMGDIYDQYRGLDARDITEDVISDAVKIFEYFSVDTNDLPNLAYEAIMIGIHNEYKGGRSGVRAIDDICDWVVDKSDYYQDLLDLEDRHRSERGNRRTERERDRRPARDRNRRDSYTGGRGTRNRVADGIKRPVNTIATFVNPSDRGQVEQPTRATQPARVAEARKPEPVVQELPNVEPKAFFRGVGMADFSDYERFDLTRFFQAYLPEDPNKRLEAMKRLEVERTKQCKQVIESFVAKTSVNEETQEEVTEKLDVSSCMFDLVPAVYDLALAPSSVFELLKNNINDVKQKSFLITVDHTGVVCKGYPFPIDMGKVSEILLVLRMMREVEPDNTNLIFLHNHITRLVNLHLIRNFGNVVIDSIGADNAELIKIFGDFEVTFLDKYLRFTRDGDGELLLTAKVTYNFLPIFSDQLDVVYVDNGSVDSVVQLDDKSFFTDHPEIYDGVLNVTLDGVMFYTVVNNEGETWLYRLDGMLSK